MRLDPDKVLANVRQAATADLMDRATLLRDGMEPEALEIIAAELARRGVTPDDLASHEKAFKHKALRDEDGLVLNCSRCGRAAIAQAVDWHRIWGLLPIFRRTYYYCDEHKPG
jgi:hypothetical protein